MTRCLALTPERNRCEKNSVNALDYCAEHTHFAPAISTPQPARGIAGFLQRRDSNDVRDDTRLAVESSLKRKSTSELARLLLDDPNMLTRWQAAYALRKRRDPGSIESLWDALHHEPVAMVRQQCVVALGKIGTGAVIGPLIEALWHDHDSGVRQASAVALGNLGITHVSQELLDVLGREHSAFVRWDCVVALGQVGDETTEPPLSQHSLTERAQVIRDACRDAIEAIRQRAGKILPPRHEDTKHTKE